MVLDSEQQRQILLQLIATAQIPGQALEVVYELKQALIQASTAPPGAEAPE